MAPTGDEHLDQELRRIYKAYSYLTVVTVFSCTLIVLSIIAILFKRGYVKNIPFLLKLTIVGFILEEIILGYASIYLIYIDMDWEQLESTMVYKMAFTLGTTVFLVNHWLFTSHYLKVASLFRLTFLKHSEQGLALVKKRTRLLHLVDVGAFGFLTLLCVYQAVQVHDESWIISYSVFWLIALCWMAPVSLLSMRHILRSAKTLERYGIYENAIIMKCYVCFWIGAGLSMLTDLTVLMMYEKAEPGSDASKRFKITFEAFSIINFSFLFGLDMMILLTYLRFSLRLGEKAVDRVTKTLRGDLELDSSVDESDDEAVEQADRQAAVKRHAYYREIADEQIRQALATMMTISRFEGGDAEFMKSHESNQTANSQVQDEYDDETSSLTEVSELHSRYDSEKQFQDAYRRQLKETLVAQQQQQKTDSSGKKQQNDMILPQHSQRQDQRHHSTAIDNDNQKVKLQADDSGGDRRSFGSQEHIPFF